MALQLATAAANVLRDRHMVRNPVTGLYERSTLLEGSRTNELANSTATGTPQASGFPPSWGLFRENTTDLTYSVISIADDPVRPGYKRVRLQVSNGGAVTRQFNIQAYTSATLAASTQYTQRVTCQRIAGSVAQINLYFESSAGSNFAEEFNATTAELTKTQTATTSASPGSIQTQLIAKLAAGGYVTLEVVAPQLEAGAFASSDILTSTGRITRAADSLSVPFTSAPQAMTMYAKFVEQGTAHAGNYAPLLSISLSDPRFTLERSNTSGYGYQATFKNASGSSATSAISERPPIGALVEIVATLSSDGKVQAAHSINGAAPVNGPLSGAIALPAGWNSARLYLNQSWNGTGFNAFLAVKVAAGIKSLDQMRALARAA